MLQMTRTDCTDVELALEDARWQAAGLAEVAPRAISQTLRHLGLEPGAFSVSILACDDGRISNLNADFRDSTGATNVLSWPSRERAPDCPGSSPVMPDPSDPNDVELGDIAISFDTVQREAAAAGTSIEHHTLHLITHATLHLLGFDHSSDKDSALMEGLEILILAELGVANPYEVIVV